MIQQIYLGVGKVITAEEAREMLRKAGADIDPSADPRPDPLEQP